MGKVSAGSGASTPSASRSTISRRSAPKRAGCCAERPARSTALQASGSAAACAAVKAAGRSTTIRASTVTWVPRLDGDGVTSWPTCKPSTPSPRATMRPAHSPPSATGPPRPGVFPHGLRDIEEGEPSGLNGDLDLARTRRAPLGGAQHQSLERPQARRFPAGRNDPAQARSCRGHGARGPDGQAERRAAPRPARRSPPPRRRPAARPAMRSPRPAGRPDRGRRGRSAARRAPAR